MEWMLENVLLFDSTLQDFTKLRVQVYIHRIPGIINICQLQLCRWMCLRYSSSSNHFYYQALTNITQQHDEKERKTKNEIVA